MIQWLITHSLQPIHTIKNELHQIKQTIINDINTIKLSLHQVSATAHTIIQKKQLELEHTLSTLCEQLYGLNPIGKLSNGFNYCETKDKTPLITIDQIKKNDRIYMVLNDGKAEATITHVDKKELLNLESTIEKLKSNELNFEEQVNIYLKTIKKVQELNDSLTTLNASIKETQPNEL